MPRQTFFNLPEEKKQTLVKAGRREFSRVPLFEASIANIIKEAGIPRGSFYQYFDDKEDLYFYILNQHAEQKRLELILLLKNNNGDIFQSVTELFYTMLHKAEDENVRRFYRNVFLHLNFKTERAFLSNINYSGISKQYTEIKHLINSNDLNVDNDEELFHEIGRASCRKRVDRVRG